MVLSLEAADEVKASGWMDGLMDGEGRRNSIDDRPIDATMNGLNVCRKNKTKTKTKQ